MDEYGTVYESNGRYVLKFVRFYGKSIEDVFRIITNPTLFTKWYPFATGEMGLKIGGKISFDDGEGTTYEGMITELDEPYEFGFHEGDDLINITLQQDQNGCRMTFTHIFDDASWAVNTATGWHRCLDVLGQIVNDEQIVWHDHVEKLREIYRERLNLDR